MIDAMGNLTADLKFKLTSSFTLLFFFGAVLEGQIGSTSQQLCLIILTVVLWFISYRFLSIRDKLEG